MKLNVFLIFISVAVAGLSAFGFYMANEGDAYRILITVGSAVSLFVTMGGMLALSIPARGALANIRLVSGLFFLVLLIEHVVFSFTGILYPPYIVVTGILLVLYALTVYFLLRVSSRVG